MTSWWLHYSALVVFLVAFVRAVPFIADLVYAVGFYFMISHAAVLLAFYTRTKLAGRKVGADRKAVLVTGCDSGFGHVLAKRLDILGYYVFAGCLFPDGDGAISLRAECSNVEVLRMDITNDEDVTRTVKEVTAKLNGMDLWAIVNNAGVPCLSEVEWCSIATYKRVLEVNLFGMVRVTRAFLPLIRASKGRIVNVNSGLGRLNVPSVSAYCMSKHASVAFTECLRMEMRRWGVKVCGIEPWFYRTNMTSVDNCLSTAHKNWENLAADVKEDYGTAYYQGYVERLKHFLIRSSRPNTMEVVECIEDAITSNEPSETYAPRGFADRLKLGFARISPEPVLDLFVERDLDYNNLKPDMIRKAEKLL